MSLKKHYTKSKEPDSEKEKKRYILQIPFIQNSRKCKVINSDRKQIRGGQGTRRMDYQGHEETLKGDGNVQNLNCGDGVTDVFIW